MGSLAQITSNIQAGITELSNTSVTAIFKKLVSALSIIIDNTLSELTNTENIINANISANNYGKAGYYIGAALYYEDGVNMVTDSVTGNRVYSPVDVSKQTISQAAFDEGTMTLKIAYIDPGTGLLSPLPGAMLTRFTNYFNSSDYSTSLNGGFTIPGLPINIVSLAANVFNSSQFIITYSGGYNLTNIQTAVTAAMTAFMNTFPYNGQLFCGDLSDYIKQQVPGVRDVNIILPTIDGVAFVGNTSLTSGFFNYSISLSLTYVAL